MKRIFTILLSTFVLGCGTQPPQETLPLPEPPFLLSSEDSRPIDQLAFSYVQWWELGLHSEQTKVHREPEILRFLQDKSKEELKGARQNDFSHRCYWPRVIECGIFSPEDLGTTTEEVQQIIQAERLQRARTLRQEMPRFLHSGPENEIYQRVSELKRLLGENITLKDLDLLEAEWSRWEKYADEIAERWSQQAEARAQKEKAEKLKWQKELQKKRLAP